MYRLSSRSPYWATASRILASGLLAALVALPAAAPATTPTGRHAQPVQTDDTSDAEAKREQALALMEQARGELDKEQFAAARELLARARTVDAGTPGLDELSRTIDAAEREALAEAREDRVDALLDSANDLRKDDRFEDALAEVAKALELDGTHRDALKLRERIQSEQAKARERALEERVEARIDAAERALKADNFEEARRLLASARESAEGFFQDDLNELASDIQRAESRHLAEQNETTIDAALETAEDALDADRFDQARAALNEIFAIDSTNRDARRLLEEVAEAERAFAAQANEREIAQRLAEGERQLRAGNLDAAEAAYRRVLELDRGNGDAREGLVDLREARTAVNAERIDSLVARAEEALDNDRLEDARALLAEAGNLDAGNRDVRRLERRLADRQSAARAQQDAAPTETTEAVRQTRTVPAPEPVVSTPEPVAESAPAPRPTFQNDRATVRRQPAEVAQVPSQVSPARPATQPTTRPAEDAAPAAQPAAPSQREADRARRRQAEAAYKEGVQLYEAGELARARQRWLDAKAIDPTYNEPDAYLENTEEEYNALLANQTAREEFERREAAALEKMNTLIPLRTLEPTVLSEFLQNLRLISGIDFVIAGEVNARVEAAFEDEPLTDVLDSVLLPIGLRWSREPGTDTVIIEPDLRTEVFALLPDQVATAQALIDDGVLGRLLYGPTGQPVLEGQEVFVDPRSNILIVTDSIRNLDKIRQLLDNLRGEQRTTLIFDSFEIDENKALEVKALLEAILSADDDQPFNTERKLILEGSTLIIKDTPQNVQRVREILQDQNFLRRFYSDELAVYSANLTPVLEFEENPDLVRAFADNVRQVVETLLYAREGRSAAEREGRRLFYDPATLQLTIVDYPDRLQTVQNYIEALPQIRNRRRTKIIPIDFRSASDVLGELEAFLGISGTSQRGAADGDQITKTLGVEDELEFRGAFFRVTRIEENDAGDENDDSVELIVRTGTTSQDVTIEEFRSEFVEDFEIVADQIRPSSTPGEGRARLIIRFVPGGQGGGEFGVDGAAVEDEQDTDDERARVAEEVGIRLDVVEPINSIFVEYRSAEELQEVEFWIRTLDIPVLQVDIELKFVEVITNKAKEFKPDFIIGDLTEGLTLSDSVLRSRFAQPQDEFRFPFEPPIETADAANLLMGGTVFEFLSSNGESPVSLRLQVLEAQGIINVINGQRIVVLNGETAEFQIDRNFGFARPEEGATGNDTENFIVPAGISPVDVSLDEVLVTRAGSITLGIDVVIEDFDQNIGALTSLDEEALGNPTLPATATPTATVFSELGTLVKTLETRARIRDGGTIVLGGWRSERNSDLESGVPILRDIPFIGKYLFERMQSDLDQITLLIFLTGNVVRD